MWNNKDDAKRWTIILTPTNPASLEKKWKIWLQQLIEENKEIQKNIICTSNQKSRRKKSFFKRRYY